MDDIKFFNHSFEGYSSNTVFADILDIRIKMRLVDGTVGEFIVKDIVPEVYNGKISLDRNMPDESPFKFALEFGCTSAEAVLIVKEKENDKE